jgi:hypothetical protein
VTQTQDQAITLHSFKIRKIINNGNIEIFMVLYFVQVALGHPGMGFEGLERMGFARL